MPPLMEISLPLTTLITFSRILLVQNSILSSEHESHRFIQHYNTNSSFVNSFPVISNIKFSTLITTSKLMLTENSQ